ncbi:hypothetical protein BDP27DRAFT_1281868 [Rhodocollybia butyracea]|uniref:Uncharacterized protein n=1 Tax=Rhodocollybia butyracea TaxID=206335 RepID=A0A9P5QBH2_9AGAR|nr:hypothetical protein BDP27DRAFT_1281868 [Rhodocollybia butyracea]
MSTTLKNAEFARLFDLFDKLASRRSCPAADFGDSDDANTSPVPTQLQPVFRNLVALVTPRTTSGSARKGRRNPVAAPSSEVIESDSESIAKFPINKQYPFKFKLMLHKLYELEEWGEKVREVLERSQKEFKPLAEKENTREARKNKDQVEGKGGAVLEETVRSRADIGIQSQVKRKGRPRSHTMASFGKGKEATHNLGSMGSTARAEPRDDERAVKRRCVGRRKSLSGLSIGKKAVWVFDAAVASSEINERLREGDILAPSPSDRYGALQINRKTVPLRCRVSSDATSALAESKIQQIEVYNKRRSLSITVVRRP